MVVEQAQTVDLKSLSLADLTKMAKSQVDEIGQQIYEEVHPATRALENLRLIERLATLPAVNRFMEMAGGSITVVETGFFGKDRMGLNVTKDGMAITSAYITIDKEGNERKNPYTHLSEDSPREIDGSLIAQFFYAGPTRQKKFVEGLASLDPRDIVEKFTRAMSARTVVVSH